MHLIEMKEQTPRTTGRTHRGLEALRGKHAEETPMPTASDVRVRGCVCAARTATAIPTSLQALPPLKTIWAKGLLLDINHCPAFGS